MRSSIASGSAIDAPGSSPGSNREFGVRGRDLAEQFELDAIRVVSMNPGLIAVTLRNKPGHRELGELTALFEQLVTELSHDEFVNARQIGEGRERIFPQSPLLFHHRDALEAGVAPKFGNSLSRNAHVVSVPAPGLPLCLAGRGFRVRRTLVLSRRSAGHQRPNLRPVEGSGALMRRTLTTAASALVALLALTGCTGTAQPPAPEPPAQPTTPAPPEPEPEAELTGDMIASWVRDQPWNFSFDGLGEPFTVDIVGGEASDDLGRTYEVGDAVEGDANGDRVPDIAIPLTEFDGNGVIALWYVWLGIPGTAEGDKLATQMVYPIARMSRCGDVVHGVTAIDGGFAVQETLRHPLDPGDCATGGTWHQTRELTVQEYGGDPFPILTAPVSAWGGICPVPGLDWLDGEGMTGIVVRSAPHPDAPVIADEHDTWGVFGLGDAPLMTATGASFFGFMPPSYLEHTSEDIERIPVRVHCAFADVE